MIEKILNKNNLLKKIMKIQKIVLIFIFINKYIYSIITIPFKRIYKEKITENNIMKVLLYNDLQITIEIGNPSQSFPVLIKLQQSPTFIMSTNYTGNIKKFNPNSSSTFISTKKQIEKYQQLHCLDGYYVKDSIIIGNEKLKIDNFEFILANKISTESSILSGEIGLILYAQGIIQNTKFLYQLKSKKIIEKEVFSLEYTKENEGNLIIGDYLHNYNNKKFKEENLLFASVGLPKEITQWSFVIDKVYSDGILIENYTNVKLNYEFGFIDGSKDYYEKVYKKFFGDYLNKNICREVQLNDSLSRYFIECDDMIEYKNFPELIFRNDFLKYNFTFTYKDLFMKYENKYYFLILFKWYIDKWNFGYPFFKKYQIFFDSDKKIFGLYPNKSNSNNWNFSPWILVFVFALLFIITLIILLIFIKYFKQKRKIRANELEDNFEYLPQYD